MSGAGNIFGEDANDGIPTLGPKPKDKQQSVKPQPHQHIPTVGSEEEQEEVAAAEMRELARERGYAGKSIHDYTERDHRDAKRKLKTFSGNPETVLECFSGFCTEKGWDDKTAFYEALRLLGEEYNFDPLKRLPSWSKMRKK